MDDACDWDESVIDYLRATGINDTDIHILKMKASGIPLYHDENSAVEMVKYLKQCILQYGDIWPIHPDVEMLILAGLKREAITLYREEKSFEKKLSEYRRKYLFPKYAKERRSFEQSTHAKIGAMQRTSKKNIIENEIISTMNWNRDSASLIARKNKVSAAYVRRIKKHLKCQA